MTNPTAFTFFLGLITQDGLNMVEFLSEDELLAAIPEVLADYGIDGFTLTKAEGYWKGQPEPSLAIYVSGIDHDNAVAIARDLAARYDQESVGVRAEQPLQFVAGLISPPTNFPAIAAGPRK